MSNGSVIRKVEIERFRGIESFSWRPDAGTNVLIGGGDVGKSTILDAIGLLLSPTTSVVLSEADYWRREYEREFVIRAVVSLSPETRMSQQSRQYWPWHWDGENAVQPSAEQEDQQAVFVFQARGTSGLEIFWEVVQPNGDLDSLPVGLRRNIGVVRLSSDERNDRDLRLVYGSALDRLLGDTGLRARINQELASINLQDNLSENAKNSLQSLDESLANEQLPHKLELGLTSSQGISIGALIGLLSEVSEGVQLPLSSWGSGTRRMASLQIAAASHTETKINLIDEVERGLEIYRTRKLVKALEQEPAQSFLTTHSPAVLSAIDRSTVWYLDSEQNLGALNSKVAKRFQKEDPETFFAKLTIVCEGVTEIGFLSRLIERATNLRVEDLGIHLTDAGGNDPACRLLKDTTAAGLTFACFVDDDGDSPTVWFGIQQQLGDLFFQWDTSTEKEVISSLSSSNLKEILKDSEGILDGERLRTLADRLDISNKNIEAIEEALAQSSKSLKQLVIEAASGDVSMLPENGPKKEWRKHGQRWFKTIQGGIELADKMFELDCWKDKKEQLAPFVNAVLRAVGRTKIEDIK